MNTNSHRQSLTVITGAAGMIGSGVVCELNQRGNDRLLLVDDLKRGNKWKNLIGKRFIDFVSKKEIFSCLQERESQIDAILHLGACSNTVEADADYLLENNFRFSIRLAEWALGRNKRFIYASSAATYGNGERGFFDGEDSIEELQPLNMYAFSKHLVDLWMKREGAFKQAVGLKYFNVFGPNEYHKGPMASMVFKMMKNVREHGIIELYKSNHPDYRDGEQQRDFIYLKDAVKWTCDLLEPPYRAIGGLYNVGSGIASSWNELAHALFCALDLPTQIQYVEMPQSLIGQYQNYTCAEMNRFFKLFPVKTAVSLSESVREYVRDYLLLKARW